MANLPLTTYEHQRLRYGADHHFTKAQFDTLAAFHERGDNRCYYDLIHRGIKLKSFVGVLQVGKLTIEVLPKLDDNIAEDRWRNRLLDMLRVVTEVSTHHPSSAHLRTRPNDILHHYLQLLAGELEHLVHGGLAKAYHGRQGNRTALRGRLLMSKHLTQNALHKERFYVADTTYDFRHPMNQILRQALDLARRLAKQPGLQNRFAELDLRFPCLPELRIRPELFDRLRYDRRTEAYRPAINIARLLLLNFHPDLRNGRNDVLALLFDMNKLWEGFLRNSLHRYLPEGYGVRRRPAEAYWTPEGPMRSAILNPDLFLTYRSQPIAILDAKWKKHTRPSSKDLQQLFTYARHYGVPHVALTYPSVDDHRTVRGTFATEDRGDLLWLPVRPKGKVTDWMKQLAATVADWLPQPAILGS